MTDIEKKARWYATKLILVYLSIMVTFVVMGYIDLFWLFVVVAAMFAITIVGAIYRDAYFTKLLELKKNEQTS